MSRPTVSVLMTTYNHEGWIEEAVESVLMQKTGGIELIIHDDGSMDGTREILNGYKSRAVIIHNDIGENLGVSKSFNRILRMANGRFIAMTSGDDVWQPEKLERQLDFLGNNQNVDICFTDSITLDALGMEGGRHPGLICENLTRGEWIARLMYGNCLLPSSVLMRRNCELDRFSFDEGMRQLQDWDLWIRLLVEGFTFAMIEEPLTKYRVVSSSISNVVTDQKSSRDNFESTRCLKNFAKLSTGEIRAFWGHYIDADPMFVKDRSPLVAISLIFARIGGRNHKLAAAELISDHYRSERSTLSDRDYHDFIGSLCL